MGIPPEILRGNHYRLLLVGLLAAADDDAGNGASHQQDTSQTIHPDAMITGGRQVEALGIHNTQRCIPVHMEDKTVTGMVYIMDHKMDFGNPSKGYYDIVHEGYEDCGLDTAVLDQAVNDSMDQAQQRMEYGGMRFF